MSKKLIIPISEVENYAEMVYVGDHVRPSSVTSVYLLDANTLACCHFDGCKMILLRFDIDAGTYRFLQCTDTTYNQEKVKTDLMSGDGNGNLVASNGHLQTCTLYRYENEQINFVKDLNDKVGNFSHGVKFYTPQIVAMTSRWESGGVYFYECETGKIIYTLKTPGASVQDISFLSKNRLAILYTLGSPSFVSRDIYSSVLQIVDFEMGKQGAQVVKEKLFKDAHIDSIILYENRLYSTDQYNNIVIVCDPESLDIIEEISGYDFPHGIDVNFGILAVTNYGNNTVELRLLND